MRPTMTDTQIANLADSMSFASCDPYAVIALFKDRAPLASTRLWEAILEAWDRTYGYNAWLSWEATMLDLGMPMSVRGAPWGD